MLRVLKKNAVHLILWVSSFLSTSFAFSNVEHSRIAHQQFKLQQKIFNASEAMGCEEFRHEFWNQLVDYILENEEVPTMEQISGGWDIALGLLEKEEVAASEKKQEVIQEIRKEMKLLIETIYHEADFYGVTEVPGDMLELIVGLDIGDTTNELKANLKNYLEEIFASLESKIKELDLICNVGGPGQNDSSKGPPFKAPRGFVQSVFGARWTMAAAYQSCRPLQLNPLNSQTPDIEGITSKCCHKDKVGNKRFITKLDRVQETHPYIRSVPVYEKECFRVSENPLIYDYGGRPKILTSNPEIPFDLFSDGGTGTKVLGTDCSGFVFLALAASGLRLAPNRELRGSDIYGPSSHSFLNPQNNGLKCLDRIPLGGNENLRAGDIASIRGHTMIIDSVGQDPFGVAQARTILDCNKLDSKDFDFVIIQSSSNKNGVGINRFEARDYMLESEKVKSGFLMYAKYLCQSRFNNRVGTPHFKEFSIVRHKGTPECLNSRLRLVKDHCIEQCPELIHQK